jgi:hypothetical protein
VVEQNGIISVLATIVAEQKRKIQNHETTLKAERYSIQDLKTTLTVESRTPFAESSRRHPSSREPLTGS